MNDRMVTITIRNASPQTPKRPVDVRIISAVALLIIGIVMAVVMWNANMEIRSYPREQLPVQAVQR